MDNKYNIERNGPFGIISKIHYINDKGGFYMKNTKFIKLFLILAIITFSITACDGLNQDNQHHDLDGTVAIIGGRYGQ